MLYDYPNEQANTAQRKDEAEAQQEPLFPGCLPGLHGYAQEVSVGQGAKYHTVFVQ